MVLLYETVEYSSNWTICDIVLIHIRNNIYNNVGNLLTWAARSTLILEKWSQICILFSEWSANIQACVTLCILNHRLQM